MLYDDIYRWILALHILAVIAWMAGLLYLPRLFVYHAGATPRGELSETLKIMERRLLRVIMNPAMIASWIFGIALAALQDYWVEGWFHGKLTLVVFLSVLHMYMARWRRLFAEDRNPHSARFYRMMNEGPTLLLIGIVIFVVVKPF